ncbi:MAG: hypothetical protein ACTTH5_04235 [Wolinella sp.]
MLKKKHKEVETLFFNSKNSIFYDLLGNQIDEPPSSARIVSAIPSLSVLHTIAEVPRNVDPAILEETLMEMAYTQLSLNLEDEYMMQFQKRNNSYDVNRDEYDVYLLPHDAISERFSSYMERHSYVDCLIPYHFIPQILYKLGFISPKGAQIFVYVGDDDAFFLLFLEGEMIYFKSLEHKIGNLHEMFDTRSGLDLTYGDFTNYLAGIASDQESHKGNLEYIYRVLYEEIEETLSFVRRLHQDVRLDLMYLDSSARIAMDFYHYLEEMTKIPCKAAYTIPIGFETKRENYLASLAILYAKAIEQGESLPNFTIYKRPLPLLQRDGGRFLAAGAAALILSLAYPAYELFYWLKLDHEIEVYTQERIIAEQKEAAYRSEIEKLQAEKKRLDEAIAERDKEYETYLGALKDIYAWQRNYVSKSRVLSDFLNASVKHEVLLNEFALTQESEALTLETLTNAWDQRAVSGFLRDLGESGRYMEATTEEISKEQGQYQSSIKAIIR